MKTALKPGVKERWIETLESVGPDRRATGVLADGLGNMCCLGWLLIATGEISDPRDVGAAARRSMPGKGEDHCAMISRRAMRRFGLDHDTAVLLAEINDGEGRFPINEIRALPEADQ